MLIASLLLSYPSFAFETRFYDDFQDGDADGWSAGGRGDVRVSAYEGNRSLLLSQQAYAVTEVTVTAGERLTVGGRFAAADLESDERCLLQLSSDGGRSWQTVARLVDGQDDGVTLIGGVERFTVPAGVDRLLLLARVAGTSDDDRCWLDDVYVRSPDRDGTPASLSAAVLFDPDRVPDWPALTALGPPAGAEAPAAGTPPFTGRLLLGDDQSIDHFTVHRDSMARQRAYGAALSRLPAIAEALVQQDGHLIPVEQAVQRRPDHPYWELAVQPGRIWQDPEDARLRRAALPFVLQERAANCTHNGVLSWAMNEAGELSRVQFQIASETCAYLQFDLKGSLSARFEAGLAAGTIANTRARFADLAAARVETAPLEALDEAEPRLFPGSLAVADGVPPETLSTLGLLVDGVHYQDGCRTRAGPHPFCSTLALPSYSLAKSLLAGVGLMRAEHIEPGVADRSIAELIEACSTERWGEVRVQDALDMATGRFHEPGASADEDGDPQVEFIFDDRHQSKLAFACNHYPKRSPPGEVFAYHTSDTYLVGTALTAWLRGRQGGEEAAAADLYDDLLRPLWRELVLSPLLDDSKRSYDDAAQPFAGYGLTLTADDMIRLGRWLRNQSRAGEGDRVLDSSLLAGALQQNPEDPGISAGRNLRYNNGFWAVDAGPIVGCGRPVWVPFLSGFGGITVALFPNELIFYAVGDGYLHRWQAAMRLAHRHRSLCP